jgi:hypothetical protein
MEARGARADSTSGSSPAPTRDPFRLGYRDRFTVTADGQSVYKQVPLTCEDLVYPQEGDMAQGSLHFVLLHPWVDAIRRFLKPRQLVVTSDVLLILKDRRTSGPDIAVIEGDFDPGKIKGAIDLKAVQGKLRFALEVISTSGKDVENKDLKTNLIRYAKEGVAEYFSLYPVAGHQVSGLVGRRLKAKGGYDELTPDAEGRVYSEQLAAHFSIDLESQELVVTSAKTGHRLLLSDEEEDGRKKAEHRADQEATARQAADQRVLQSLRRTAEDLCLVLGLAWTAERNAQVEAMNASELEALRTTLVSEKRWP